MPVTQFLERNAKLYGNEVALVELNPEMTDKRRTTWKDYELMQPTSSVAYRREITWGVFDEKANRFANMLLSRGVKKGDKVAIIKNGRLIRSGTMEEVKGDDSLEQVFLELEDEIC